MSSVWDSDVRAKAEIDAALQHALVEMRKVLDATRNPKIPADVEHTYDDKYAVVNQATQAALVAQLNILCDGFGLSAGKLAQLQKLAAENHKTVTLRFDQSSSCEYADTVEHEVEGPAIVSKGLFGKTTHKNITRVIHHVWKYEVEWAISAYVGAFADEQVVELKRRRGHVYVKTRVTSIPVKDHHKKSKKVAKALDEAKSKPPARGPFARRHRAVPVETEITWLLKAVEGAIPHDDIPAAVLEADTKAQTAPGTACPKGHPLATFLAPTDTQHICDQCNVPQAVGAVLQRCRGCDFDLCSECASKVSMVEVSDDVLGAASAVAAAAPPVGRVNFCIDRNDSHCHTPSNNAEIKWINDGASTLTRWTSLVNRAITGAVRTAVFDGSFTAIPNLQYNSVASSVFNPVLACFTLESRSPAITDSAANAEIADANNTAVVQFVTENSRRALDSSGSPATLLSSADFTATVRHHRASLQRKFTQLQGVMPRGVLAESSDSGPGALPQFGIHTTQEGVVRVACAASLQIWRAHFNIVAEVEDMLRDQLVKAIGSVVSANDFAKYMDFHKRQLFRSDVQPQAFSYAIRRPNHYPDGILSIESNDDAQPIRTTTVHREVGHVMNMPLASSVNVQLHGDHYVHAHVSHQFSTRNDAPRKRRAWVNCPEGHGLLPSTTPRAGFSCDKCHSTMAEDSKMHSCRACNWDVCSNCYDGSDPAWLSWDRPKPRGGPLESSSSTLIARARQYSSFVLLMGTLNAADEFNPTNALVMRNKDEVKIPLILSTIPTPKEFQRKISSLSKEQQAFANAYRKMQLAGTLFAVATIQIKPNLERLLNLPPDALTKEVTLCENLMRLFVEYQIPSDLLSYSGDYKLAPARMRIASVKKNVANIDKMLDEAKQAELELQRQEEMARRLQAEVERMQKEKESMSVALNSLGGFDGATWDGYAAECDFEAENCAMACEAECWDDDDGDDDELCAELCELDDGEMDDAPTGTAEEVSNEPSPATNESPEPAADRQDQQSEAQPQESHDSSESAPASSSGDKADVSVIDYTALPHRLNANFDSLDVFDSLRPTKIAAAEQWSKTEKDGVMSKEKTRVLDSENQRAERVKAFDLLDALSRSGALPLEGCTLHVVVAATHCFDRSLMDTLVRDNINPIARAESSEVIVAKTLHDVDDARTLVQPQCIPRLEEFSRHLIPQ